MKLLLFLASILAACTMDDAPPEPAEYPYHLESEHDSDIVVIGRTDGTIEGIKLQAENVHEACRRLAQIPGVAWVEPNWHYYHQDMPRTITDGGIPRVQANDPLRVRQWGLDNRGQLLLGSSADGGLPGIPDVDMDAPEAWALVGGAPQVWVGVVDEGADYTHPDLEDVIVNPGEDVDGDGRITSVDMNGVDDDGNGFVDDVHGWDFINNSAEILVPSDEHGTHVSGIIAARGGDRYGVTGVAGPANGVRLVVGKAFAYFGTVIAITHALHYMADLKMRGLPLVAVNASWGGGPPSQAIHAAIRRLCSLGVLFVAAAGNSTEDVDMFPYYPAAFPDECILTVASIDRWDSVSWFSNWGFNTIDVASFGSDVLSTVPGNSWEYWDGTSMATPHVSGIAALVKIWNPGMNGVQIKHRIMDTVVRTPNLIGRVVTEGRVNAWRALLGIDTLDP